MTSLKNLRADFIYFGGTADTSKMSKADLTDAVYHLAEIRGIEAALEIKREKAKKWMA